MLRAMFDLLVSQPLLLLFVVLALGYALGRVSVAGIQLGIAAVLFVGLAAGALDPRLALPDFAQRFGLVLFVYAIGVSSGPGFVTSLRRRGLRDTFWTIGLLVLAAGIARAAQAAFGFPSSVTAGLFCGALTNTPALAAVLERLPVGAHGPVVGYSVAYPFGALGIVLALAVAKRLWKRELDAAARSGHLDVRFVLVTREDAVLCGTAWCG